MLYIISLIDDKNTALYQDYQFKINFIDKFLLDNLECNSQTLDNIKNFNQNFEYEYNNFRKYFLEIM